MWVSNLGMIVHLKGTGRLCCLVTNNDTAPRGKYLHGESCRTFDWACQWNSLYISWILDII